MTFAAVLTSGEFLLALAVLLVAGLLEPVVSYRCTRWFNDNQAFHWGWSNFFAPVIRATIIVVFVLLAYPSIFGIREAPRFIDLISDTMVGVTNLIGLLFILSLALPLLPPFKRHLTALIAVQGLIAVATVFSWYVDYIAANAVSIFPGWIATLAIVLMSALAHHLAQESGHALGTRIDAWLDVKGIEVLAPNAMALLFQAPVMLYYGMILGRQLAV